MKRRRPAPPDRRLLREVEFEEQQPLLRGLAPRIRPDVDMVAQTFRGKPYYVLQDPVSLQYFRIGETGHHIVSRFDGHTTLGDIHADLREDLGDDAPGFDELARFVFALRNANLLVADSDSERFLERVSQKWRGKVLSTASNFLFFRLPLVDPERFLRKTMPLFNWVFSWPVFFVWCGVVLAGLVTAILHLDGLLQPVNGVLAPANLPLLWVSFVVIKVFHELGHAYAAKHYGAEVHRMGILFLVFVPCFYVDVTAAWAFKSKRAKVLVGMGGMMVEIFLASLALFLWLLIEPGTLRTIAFNVIFIASVSTILFNANPLLRYDGYYILADALEIPNLRMRSSQYLLYLLERYVIGIRKTPPPAEPSEKRVFVWYGILATIYRTMIVCGIILMIASRFFIIGVVIAIVTAFVWLAVPTGKAIKYLFFSPQTFSVRARAFGVVVVAAVVVVVLAGFVPLPRRASAPCVVEAYEKEIVRPRWAGFVTSIRVRDGQDVQAGDVLVQLSNEQLDYDLVRIEKDIVAAEVKLNQLQTKSPAQADAQAYRLAMLREEQAVHRQRRDDLTLRAPIAGRVIAPSLDKLEKSYVKIGEPLLKIAAVASAQLEVVLDEDSVSEVEESQDRVVRVRLKTDPGKTLEGRIVKIASRGTTQAPPAALCHYGGGPVVVDGDTPENAHTVVPWFKVEVNLEGADPADVPLGATGTAKFRLESAPLAYQIYWRARKVLKKRFLI